MEALWTSETLWYPVTSLHSVTTEKNSTWLIIMFTRGSLDDFKVLVFHGTYSLIRIRDSIHRDVTGSFLGTVRSPLIVEQDFLMSVPGQHRKTRKIQLGTTSNSAVKFLSIFRNPDDLSSLCASRDKFL